MANPNTCNLCGTILESDTRRGSSNEIVCPNCGIIPRQVSVYPKSIRAAAELVVGGVQVKAEARPEFGEPIRATADLVLGGVRVKAKARTDVVEHTNLLMQTIVEPGPQTDEGLLIKAVALPWFEIIDLLKGDPAVAYQIDHRAWEEIVAGAYHKAGFDDVTLTPRSGDLGRDVIAVKRGLGTIRIIDQVKAYGPNHLVTADDVRALLGVLDGDKASKGFLTTTSDFAPKLRDDILLQPFFPARLELINGKLLLARLEDLAERRA